jgi:hypothetical protein
VLDKNVAAVAAPPLNVHVNEVVERKFTPVTVTTVPPKTLPYVRSSDVMSGIWIYVYTMAGVVVAE